MSSNEVPATGQSQLGKSGESGKSECWRLTIYGRVQGVGFRYSVLDFVENNGVEVVGFVKNLINGAVEVVAQGEKSELMRLHAFCLKGPARATVERVDIDRSQVEGDFQYDRFSIR